MNIVGLGQLARKSISVSFSCITFTLWIADQKFQYTMMDSREIAMREIEFDLQFEAFLDLVVNTLSNKKGSK